VQVGLTLSVHVHVSSTDLEQCGSLQWAGMILFRSREVLSREGHQVRRGKLFVRGVETNVHVALIQMSRGRRATALEGG